VSAVYDTNYRNPIPRDGFARARLSPGSRIEDCAARFKFLLGDRRSAIGEDRGAINEARLQSSAAPCTLLARRADAIDATCNATYLSSSTRWDYRANDGRRSTFCTSGELGARGAGGCIAASARGRVGGTRCGRQGSADSGRLSLSVARSSRDCGRSRRVVKRCHFVDPAVLGRGFRREFAIPREFRQAEFAIERLIALFLARSVG